MDMVMSCLAVAEWYKEGRFDDMVTVITGAIGSGKSTVAGILRKKGYVPVIEYTTRPMRKGEEQDVDYHFVDDATFDRMENNGEFAEVFHVNTIYGLWKYGAAREDMVNDRLLVCGPHQMLQLLGSGIHMKSVLLDIDKKTAMERAMARGDDMEEFKRRFDADEGAVAECRGRVSMLIASELAPEKIAARIAAGHVFMAQEMTEPEKELYLEGDEGLRPYLRMRKQGMPEDPVNQVAWLLLNGSGCGFCKVCRSEPCGIKDGETCTHNIADYIRECVHMEDWERNKEDG